MKFLISEPYIKNLLKLYIIFELMSEPNDKCTKCISDDDKKIGLLPKIWGPPTWESNHAITFGYPIKPTNDDKKHMETHFKNLGHVLPCCECSKHFISFVTENKDTKLTDAILESRTNLTKWFWNIHKTVCENVGIQYDISYEMLCKKYESYRASTCDQSDENIESAFKNYYDKEAPFLSYKDAKMFSKYAKERGLSDFDKYLDNLSVVPHDSCKWKQRNKESWKIIKQMRIDSIPSFEKSGEHKGYPTLLELQLIKRMSCSSNKKINAVIKLMS